ncbi:hypothetical protein GCM10022225_22260 [Plantactinospora mayteni]|uniref:Right handed beta helix domain-containing protein n=1 Tax=Plantactinospora mayteni TaxID=566021 RepID=A0ABQ4EP39_9ACTN|nr:hypothetical protein [Plantactinospora mayteni]GIG96408.1 hypothetical protein Pma05_29810 [Plantactinospora mayteni]
MSEFQGSHVDPGQPTTRPKRRRSRWFLAGGIVAGSLMAGAAGLAGVATLASDRGLADVDLGQLSVVAAENDKGDNVKDPGKHEDPKDPKAGPTERKDQNGKHEGGEDSQGDWQDYCKPGGGWQGQGDKKAEDPKDRKDPKAGPSDQKDPKAKPEESKEKPGESKESMESKESKDPKAGPEPKDRKEKDEESKDAKESKESKESKDPKAGPEPKDRKEKNEESKEKREDSKESRDSEGSGWQGGSQGGSAWQGGSQGGGENDWSGETPGSDGSRWHNGSQGGESGSDWQGSGSEGSGWNGGSQEGREGCGSDKREDEKVTSVPCDPDKLIAALVHANAEGGGSLKLAPKCTYTLTASNESGEKHNGKGEKETGKAPTDAGPMGAMGAMGAGGAAGAAGAPAAAAAAETMGSPGEKKDDKKHEKKEEKNEDRSGLPVIKAPIKIKGEGATIRRDTYAKDFRFFTVRDGGDLELSNVFLRNGRAGEGGAISIDHGATATVKRVTISDSTALRKEGGGGAIFNDGHLAVLESKFERNSSAGDGGGILNGGVLTVEKSEFFNNSADKAGGGLANHQGAADINKSAFEHNNAAEGGGIASISARTKIWDGEVKGNTAKVGGGIFNKEATLTIRGLNVSDNLGTEDGGGIATIKGLLTVDESKITKNTTRGDGGGIFAEKSEVIVRDTEVSKNRAVGARSVGGGIAVEGGSLELKRDKIVENEATKKGGGLFAEHAKVRVDDDTVISKNRPDNCAGEEIENCFA